MGHSGRRRDVLSAIAAAVAVFGVYRFAVVSVPSVWHFANALGGAYGNLAGSLSGQPLRVGSTFGGVDFLVLYGGSPRCLGRANCSSASEVAWPGR